MTFIPAATAPQSRRCRRSAAVHRQPWSPDAATAPPQP